jgi:GH25 family lysozyme M1 (1,4-beta-N-acetylmuramidase)
MILSNAIIVDVSHWQPPASIDWAAAKGAGVVGAIVKLMQGGVPDTAAVYHLYNAYQAGVSLLGVYDFGTAQDDHVTFLKQALAEFQGDMGTRLLVLDAERYSNQMGVSGMVHWQVGVQAATGRWPLVYMGRDGPDGTGHGLPNAELSRSDLWLPKYGPQPDAAHLPPGFRLPANDTERGGVCRLWQFTGDGINAPSEWPAGIPQKNDLSYALFDTMDGLTAWWQGN